jgi:RNA polymerase sigma-70 factor (ECF subfamily)
VAALYVDHGEDLRAFLLGVLRNGEQATEALQNTFARALEQGHTVQSGSFRGWLFRVAFNEAMLLRRRKGVEARARDKWPWFRPVRERVEENAEQSLIRWELVEQVQEALRFLPDEQREVVQLRIHDGLTFAEIAGRLELPLGTVLTRMRLALKKLRLRLEGLGDDAI